MIFFQQQPHSEINDNNTSAIVNDANITNNIIDATNTNVDVTENVGKQEELNTSNVVIRRSLSPKTTSEDGFITRIFITITQPWLRFLSIPKISGVIRNIGTCLVNGIMEIIAHFCPPPLMPLVASAAGMLIPYEPVVTLKRINPVESYRRAFSSAVDSFLGAFETFKHDDDDPYMQKRFYRRFMKEPKNIKLAKISEQTLNEY